MTAIDTHHHFLGIGKSKEERQQDKFNRQLKRATGDIWWQKGAGQAATALGTAWGRQATFLSNIFKSKTGYNGPPPAGFPAPPPAYPYSPAPSSPGTGPYTNNGKTALFVAVGVVVVAIVIFIIIKNR